MNLRIQLFGEVCAWRDNEPVRLGPAQQRAVFALLVLAGGRPLSRDALVSALWGDDPPRHAANVIQTYIMHLRRSLDPERVARAPSGVLTRSGDGYLLRLVDDEVDVLRFRRLVAVAREAHRSGGHDACAAAAEEALRLWQATPVADVPLLASHPLVAALVEERWAVVAWFADAALCRGTPGDALAVVEEGVAARTLDEPLHGWPIRLYAALGRRADALGCYERLRRRLVDELGVDPTPQLRELRHAVLSDEAPRRVPAARSLPPDASPAGPSHQVPRQLPAPPQLFTGRAMELADLGKIHDASTVVITAIDGMAGVGKTALAVHAAHQMVDRYPDGQLFIDLHGYTDGVAPVEPGEALDQMLRALGMAGDRIPANLDQRAGLYRSRLADQRMVIVLDNAATESQVTPLLPGAPGCVVLVTSRRRLAGLDHTHTLSLDTLPLPDAITLLRQTAGESRLFGQSPDVAAELVELCGRLPLAIRIAAARLRSHPTWTLDHLVQRLRDERHRLVELEAGRRSVTAALDLSYRDLSDDLRRGYRLVGLHPGPDIDAYAAAALLDGTLREGGRVLEQLLEAHLLQEPAPGRYRFHDLTRAHAAHTATRDETEHSRRMALDGLLGYYRHTAAAAMDAAYPYEREHRPRVPPARTPSPTLPHPAAALGWLDSELPNQLATARHAVEHGRPAHLLHVSAILHRHLRTRGRLHAAETLQQQALSTARATGDQAAELDALTGLGHVHRLQGRYDHAIDHYQQALELAPTIGHQTAELDALAGLGQVHLLQCRYEQATDHLERALRLAPTMSHHPGRTAGAERPRRSPPRPGQVWASQRPPPAGAAPGTRHRPPQCRADRTGRPRRNPPGAGSFRASHRLLLAGAAPRPRSWTPPRRAAGADRPRRYSPGTGPVPAGHRALPTAARHRPAMRPSHLAVRSMARTRPTTARNR
ncbi:BTAD domain-containing putative transcriptional regulator [Rugosimonospora acidiphila]|uniref:BTAD domain-containing putative transcriptional regulator n=1 Tax=Rugosimonospora acidiphila TaxID=556531 RepID=A0ABP9RM27_9ACTN